MGVEEHRKKLMLNSPTWGDRRSAHVVGGTSCNCEVGASTPIGLMNHVVNPPSPLGSRIYTCGWIFEDLLRQGKRFRPVPRVPLKEATKAVIRFDKDGVPLIIEGLHKEANWSTEDFHPDSLKNDGSKEISVRNVYDWTDKTITFDDFIEKSRSMPIFASPEEQERLYGKDAKCPENWARWLCDSKIVPSSLLPNNVEDILSSRHVETLMCYIGVGDTFTPCHKDLCASSGQNLMCYTEMDGSSFWFMTKGADAPEASKYFHKLNQELDHETHVITVEQLANAPFDVYIAQQKLGDLVLVPPRSCHQVVNYGGITIKTSWSRMTLRGLEIAYYHELPIYRRVCRPEIYRVKSAIYQTLIKRRDLGQAVLTDEKLRSTTKDLLKLFDSVLLEESPAPHRRLHCLQPIVPGSLVDSSTIIGQLTCDFCGADIFQSFFECLSCVNAPNSEIEHGDGFVICAGCYVEGRSCKCGNMEPMQCRPFQDLLAARNKVAEVLSKKKLEDNSPALATGTFRAACKLQEMRRTLKEGQRTCSTTVVGSSHLVPCSWVLNCKKCHRSRCFTHILTSQKLHAVDALLIHASDSSHEEHHRHHVSSLQKYNEGRDSFLQTQRMGSKPDFIQQRVHLAEQFHTCKPINSAFTQAGWYDIHVQLVPTIFEAKDNSTNSPQDSPMSPAPPLSPSTDLGPLPLLHKPTLVNRTTVADASLQLKRKRVVMDFVDVPSRTYKVGASENSRQEFVSDVQVISRLPGRDLSTTSAVAYNMVRERDQEVMQTDPPRSPPTSGRDKVASRSPSSMSQTLLGLSPSEADFENSMPSSLSHTNDTKKHTSKKPRPLSPSSSSLTSSTSTRVHRFAKRSQTRISNSTGNSGKDSRLDGPPSTSMASDQTSDLAKNTDSEENQRKSVPVRKLPRIKKIPQNTQRVSSDLSSYQASSSSSPYPRSTLTPSDVPDLAQVINGAVNENYFSQEALETDFPLTETGQAPPIDKQAAQTTLTDNAALTKAIKDLTEAVHNITQLQKIPSQSYDPIRAFATAPGDATSYYFRYMIPPATPSWFQRNSLSVFQPYPPSSPKKWSTSGYQQSSQYPDSRSHAAAPFESGSSSWSPVDHSYIPPKNLYNQDDGPNMRLDSYSSIKHDFYGEDHKRRWNNRDYPYRPWQSGSRARDRLPRSAMKFDKAPRRNNRSFVSSYPRLQSGGGRPKYNQSPRAESASGSTIQIQGRVNNEANNQTNEAVENLVGRALPRKESSPRWLPSGQLISSSVPEPPIDNLSERPPGSQVQQHDKADRVQQLMSPSFGNDENGRSLVRFGSPTHSANWEDDYEQDDPAIDKEVPRTEICKSVQQQAGPSKPIQQQAQPSEPIQQNEFPSPLTSLYENPWAS